MRERAALIDENGNPLATSIVGGDKTLNVNISGIDVEHKNLSGLTDGDAGHTQFAWLLGRSGGQALYGGTGSGENLTLRSTSNSSKGQVIIDENTDSTSTTSGALKVVGGVGIALALFVGGAIKSNTSYLLKANSGTNVLTQTYASGGSSYGVVWPQSQGGSNTFLKNDGSGNLSWGSAGINPDANNNVFVGIASPAGLTTGQQNMILASVGSGASFTSASYNVLIGNNTGNNITTGIVNTGIGDTCLRDLTTGSFHTAVGSGAGASVTTANSGCFFGYRSGTSVTTGAGVSTFGVEAGVNITSGSLNSAGGVQALRDCSTSPNNSAWGATALAAVTTGTGGNSGFGKDAGITLTTGNKCSFFGATSDTSSATRVNATAIGYGAIVAADNVVVLGSGGVNVGVDSITAPTARLHLPAGTATAGTASLKINPGTLLGSVEDGALEYDGTHLYFTIGASRTLIV